MSALGRYVGVATAAATVAVAGTAVGVLAGRRAAARVRAAADVPLGSVRGDSRIVITDDGVILHAEVDEPTRRRRPNDPTIVFVHGFGLNLDCWHYQRLALRDEYRLVLYDQRSHGRSGRSQPQACTIHQLGQDLKSVLEAMAPTGPVVVVGHSMGGMTLLSLAHQFPDWFRHRVAGVALVSASADGMGEVTFGLPSRLGRLFNNASPSVLAAIARAPRLVESGRRIGAPYTFALIRRFAYASPVSQELVDFTDEMLRETPVDVLASFYPEFGRLDVYETFVTGPWPPTTVLCGAKDQVTPPVLSRRMAEAVPHSRLVEVPDAGHLVMLEHPEPVNDELELLLKSLAS